MIMRLLLLFCVGLLSFFPHLVAAHSWYPKRCCDDMDCFQPIVFADLQTARWSFQKGQFACASRAPSP